MDGGGMVVRVLKAAGVEVLFTLHGTHIDPILQACLDEGMRVVDTRHEAAAGHAAEGYTRSTARLGVAVVTAGPGFANVLTSVLNAYLDCMPVLYLAGGAPLREEETNPMQGGYDQVAVVRPMTKWAHRVSRTEDIPRLLLQGIRTALSGRPGPVFLEFPMDVLFRHADGEVPLPERLPMPIPPHVDPQAAEAALDLLEQAERPVILVGGGVWLSRAEVELRAFAERTSVPVFANTRGLGVLPGDHPLFGGSFYNLAHLAGEKGPDLVLLLGARLGMFTGGLSGSLIPQQIPLIQVDIHGEELGKLREATLAIQSDCKAFLARALEAAAKKEWPARSAWQRTVQAAACHHEQAFGDLLGKNHLPLHPYQVVRAVRKRLPADALLVADGAEAFHWMEMIARPRQGGSFLAPGYLSCLGTGLPFSVGAQVAHPRRPVVCVVGDGALGLNIQEFHTLVRHELPVSVVVLNNLGWGASFHGQEIMYGPHRLVASRLGRVDYHEVARAFGCHGRLVKTLPELEEALEEMFSQARPSCLNVMTDPQAMSPRIRHVAGTLAQQWGTRQTAEV